MEKLFLRILDLMEKSELDVRIWCEYASAMLIYLFLSYITAVLLIPIGFRSYPDPTFYLSVDPDSQQCLIGRLSYLWWMRSSLVVEEI